MSVYTAPALNAVDFGLTATTPESIVNHPTALTSYSAPSLTAVDFELVAYTLPLFQGIDFELADEEQADAVGTIAATLGGLTSSISGQVQAVGAIAATLAPISSAISGAVETTGAIASTLGALSSVIVGESGAGVPASSPMLGIGWRAEELMRRHLDEKERSELEVSGTMRSKLGGFSSEIVGLSTSPPQPLRGTTHAHLRGMRSNISGSLSWDHAIEREDEEWMIAA